MRDCSSLRTLAALLAFTAPALAQSTPPACPGISPATKPRPTAQQIRSIAEADAADPTIILAHEPLENFGAIRYRIADYADCTGGGGCYWADLDAQYTRAQAALKLALESHKPAGRPALVLDIDETTLSSYCEMQKEDYGYVKPMFESWIVSPAASIPIPGTLRLYKQARAAGVAVFFITGRPDEQRTATATNLKTAGFDSWAGLSLRVASQKTMSASEYKSQERQKILDAGYTIVMNVGDQWSDLDGTARAAINVKLPNPFYYLP